MNQLELKVKNIHKYASFRAASCLTTCESLASIIFVETGKRPDLYCASNFHYHLRINNFEIVDPTVTQFFLVPKNYEPRVFIGSLSELKNYLKELEQLFGFNENNLYVKTNRPKHAEDLYHLWSQSRLSKSGTRLRKMILQRSGKQKAWYE